MKTKLVILMTGLGLVFFFSCLKKQGHEILEPDVPTYEFNGVVKDLFHQSTIENVSVILHKDSVAIDTTISNSEGYFNFTDIVFDNINSIFHLTLNKTGYERKGNFVDFEDKNMVNEIYLCRALELEEVFDSPGNYPFGICWDGNNIWTVDYEEGELYKHDNHSGAVLDEYLLPDAITYPKAAAFDGAHFWVNVHEGLEIFKLDLDLSRVVFKDTLYFLSFEKSGILPVSLTDFTFNGDGEIVTVEILSDIIGVYNPNNTNIVNNVFYKDAVYIQDEYLFNVSTMECLSDEFSVIDSVMVERDRFCDPTGICWTGSSYYLIIESSKIILVDFQFNLTDIYELNINIGSLSHLAYDGEYLWCVDNVLDKIYKLKNLFY